MLSNARLLREERAFVWWFGSIAIVATVGLPAWQLACPDVQSAATMLCVTMLSKVRVSCYLCIGLVVSVAHPDTSTMYTATRWRDLEVATYKCWWLNSYFTLSEMHQEPPTVLSQWGWASTHTQTPSPDCPPFNLPLRPTRPHPITPLPTSAPARGQSNGRHLSLDSGNPSLVSRLSPQKQREERAW